MKNNQEKIKIATPTKSEFEDVTRQAISKLATSSKGELQAALTGLAELFVSSNADCENIDAEKGFALALVIRFLEENRGASCLPGFGLETMAPISNFSN